MSPVATATITATVGGLDDEESVVSNGYNPFYSPLRARPVLIHQSEEQSYSRPPALFLARPFFGPLLFDNNDSDARDHCACERTFLSWLRLSIYMAIVSVAIVMSFHLKTKPTPIERQMAFPLGLVFWGLALICLASGVANYVKTVTKYSRRQTLVQSGWKTQVVFSVVATAIIAVCILFLSVNAKQQR
ncbi:MAG: ATP-dependent RNA helicase dbp4 [Chaenotheca gracillima]|nr:MAG: ATP-dependent RNA helicase dbp4 [Chaenotheca gracillima]